MNYIQKELNTTDYASLELHQSSDTSISKHVTDKPYPFIKFTTDFISQPQIKPSQRTITIYEKGHYNLQFSSTIPVEHTFENALCYRNGILLRNGSRTRISVDGSTINLHITCPLRLDSGYYQCAVAYDVLYISSPVHLEVEAIAETCSHATGTVRDISAESAILDWSNTVANRTHGFNDEFIVVLSSKKDMLTSLSSIYRYITRTNQSNVTLPNLKAFTVYYWLVTDQSGNFITDRLSFKTSPSLSEAKVAIATENVTDSDYTVTWKDVLSDKLHDRPEEKYYKVQLSVAGRVVVTTTTKHPTYTATNLDPLTDYTLRVEVCNSVGCANPSSVNVKTNDVLFDKAPTLSVIQRYNRNIKIVIHPPRSSRTTMVRISNFYDLENCNENTMDMKPEGENQTLIHRLEPVYVIDGLQFYKTYYIKAQIFNHHSVSPWSPCVSYRTTFDYIIVVIPILSVAAFSFVLFAMSVGIKQRYPNVVQDLKSVLNKHVFYLQPDGNEEKQYDMLWDEDIEIVHMSAVARTSL